MPRRANCVPEVNSSLYLFAEQVSFIQEEDERSLAKVRAVGNVLEEVERLNEAVHLTILTQHLIVS